MMNWDGIIAEIAWGRCLRRQWPATERLEFSVLERRKPSDVLLFWWAGRGERSTPEGVLPVGPGVCHWSRPGFDYACTQDMTDPLGVTAIPFHLCTRQGAALTALDLGLVGENLRVVQPELVDCVTRLVAEVAEQSRLGATPLAPGRLDAATALFRGLLMQLVMDTGAQEEPAQAVAGAPAYIREHLAGDLDVAGLARRFGCSRSHFTRLFTALTGLSPHQYVIQSRLTLAQELLTYTGLTVSEVAAETGFSSVHHFCRQFLKTTGITPTGWRARQDEPQRPQQRW